MSKSIIMIPYANLKNMRGGVNVSEDKRFDIYMKNCCVALLSAKRFNSSSDIALITNIDIPNKYRSLLTEQGILVIKAEFNTFVFSNEYKWGLAYYKLCALKYMVENYDYDFYSYMDSDVYIQQSFENIWNECEDNILLYDINHGLQVRDYNLFLKDIFSFTSNRKKITHYGGEFFAASKENAKLFISECYSIYEKMLEDAFYTSFGDEFIISQAAEKHRLLIKNAGAYIYRFWTGSFRLVSTCFKYNPVAILHLPDEKNRGILKIYKYYERKKHLPSNERVYNILNLKHRNFRIMIRQFIKKIFRRI